MEKHPEITVQIVTPYGIFYDGSCELVVIPTSDGEQGVMYGHMPFIAAVYPGQLKLINGEKKRAAFVSAGYAEVSRKAVEVICNAAEWAEDIDTERAKKALSRAKERLNDKDLPEYLHSRNRHAARRAKARLYVAEIYQKSEH